MPSRLIAAIPDSLECSMWSADKAPWRAASAAPPRSESWSACSFTGKLAELNLGTADGRACGPGVGEALLDGVSGYSAMLNGRFKGGYITRTYGEPANGVHAVQLELSEATYMEESPPFRFRDDLAKRLRPQLRALIEEFCRLGPGLRRD